MDNSSDGDTILVYPGVYYEKVVVDKSVTLRGIGQPVVDAGGSGSSITLTADGITLEGFNVTNAERSYVIPVEVEYGAGIKVISSNNIITSNTVSNNDNCISLVSSSNNTITGNTVRNDYIYLYLYNSINNVFYCNNFIINSTDNFSECAWAIEEAVKKAIEVIMGERKEEVNEEIGKEVGKTKEQPKNPVNSASPNTWNSTKEIRYIYNGTTHEGYLGNYWSDWPLYWGNSPNRAFKIFLWYSF